MRDRLQNNFQKVQQTFCAMSKKWVVVERRLKGFTASDGLPLEICINHIAWHLFWPIPVSLLYKRLAIYSHHLLHLYSALQNSKATVHGNTLLLDLMGSTILHIKPTCFPSCHTSSNSGWASLLHCLRDAL